MLPTIRNTPSRLPMNSRGGGCAGTSFATGLPRLVIVTCSLVERTSSISMRQGAENLTPVSRFETGAKLDRYCPAGFSAGLAAGFLPSAIPIFGFQKSGSALIHASEA